MAPNLHVLMFEDQDGAENFLENVTNWEEQGLFTVVDAVTAKRGPGSNVEVEQTNRPGRKLAGPGAGIGLIAGILLGGPIGGLAAGAAIGGITGSMRKNGIDSKLVDQVNDGLAPNTSALFLMTQDGQDNLDQVLDELRPHKARLASSTLAPEQEALIRAALAREE